MCSAFVAQYKLLVALFLKMGFGETAVTSLTASLFTTSLMFREVQYFVILHEVVRGVN